MLKLAQPLAFRTKDYYWDAARRSLLYNEAHIPWMIWATLALIVAAIFDMLVGEPTTQTIYIRVGMAITAYPLTLQKKARFNNTIFWSAYWLFACTAIFPFGFGLMLALNAASTPTGESLNQFWLIQYLVALFLFVQLVCFLRLSLPLWAIASCMCYASICFVESPNMEEVRKSLIYPLSAYVTAVVFGTLFNRNNEIVISEKSETASVVSLNVAHELRTPLAGIRRFAEGISTNLSELISGYELAKQRGLIENPLNDKKARRLEEALSSISEEVAYSNTIIDMLLISTTEQGANFELEESCSAFDSCEKAIARFPFNNDSERRMVKLDLQSDFQIELSQILVIHMLFNLVKNAIPHALGSNERLIKVRVGGRSRKRTISVTNSGSDLDESTAIRIFDRFYTTQPIGQGAGIGLSFCKRTMDSIGGEIYCNPQESGRCEFVMNF